MKSLVNNLIVLSVAILYLGAPCFSQQQKPTTTGMPLGPARLAGASGRATCSSTDMGPKCSDCNTILTCVGSFQVNQQTCSSLDPKRPYCRDNACVATASDACASSTFRCTEIGQFPDPYDCSRYYVCSGKGLDKAYVYMCPSGFVYESKSGLCKRTTCQTINCSSINSNKYVIFDADPSIMAYCLDNELSKEIVLFRCPDPQNMHYDPATFKCTYACSAEGRFTDKMDCHSFYECYRIGTTFYMQHQTCPNGYSYDSVSRVCIQKANCRNEIGDEAEDGSEASGAGPELFIEGGKYFL